MVLFKTAKIKRCQCYGCAVCKEIHSMCPKHEFTASPKTNGHPCNDCQIRKACSKFHESEWKRWKNYNRWFRKAWRSIKGWTFRKLNLYPVVILKCGCRLNRYEEIRTWKCEKHERRNP